MAWVSPTGGSGLWTNIPNAYDGNTATYTFDSAGMPPGGSSALLELTIVAISCSKVRVNSLYSATGCYEATVEVYYSGAYHSLGTKSTSPTNTWVEWAIGSVQSVTKLRVSYDNNSLKFTRPAFCYEAQFWEVVAPTAYKDIATRFKLTVRNYKDIPTRFKLTAQNFTDVLTRFRLTVQGFTDIATRFALQVQSYRDIATRFLLHALGYTDTKTRFILVGRNYCDTATRFYLIAPPSLWHEWMFESDNYILQGRPGSSHCRT
jgi:hypothetical protein